MIPFAAEQLHVGKFNDFHASVFRPLLRRRSGVLEYDEFLQTFRRTIQKQVAFLIVFANYDCYIS